MKVLEGVFNKQGEGPCRGRAFPGIVKFREIPTSHHHDFKLRCTCGYLPTYECGGEVEAPHQTAVLRDDPALGKTGVRNLVLRDQGSCLRELEALLLVRASSVASSVEQR